MLNTTTFMYSLRIRKIDCLRNREKYERENIYYETI